MRSSGGVKSRLSEVHDDALDARAEADPRRWRAAKLLDQSVVSSTRAERCLGALDGGMHLKDGAGVVIQTAHERWRNLVRYPPQVQDLPYTLKMLGAMLAEPVRRRGRGPE